MIAECGEWVLATRGSGGVDVSPSSAIKWVATYRTTGSWAAELGGAWPLKRANFLLTLIERQSS